MSTSDTSDSLPSISTERFLWSKPMPAFRDAQAGFGTAKSPVVDEARVYIVNDNEKQSFISAYDKKTGAELWRMDREGDEQLDDTIRLEERETH